MAYRSASSNSVASSDTLTITKPSGVVDNDWMLAWLVWDGNSADVTTVPSDWTALGGGVIINTAPDNQRARCYERKASSEGTDYTWVLTGSNASFAGCIVAFSGRNTASSSTVSTPTTDNSSNTTPISVAITGLTAASGDDLCWFAQLDQTVQADVWGFSAPTNYTERVDISSAGGWMQLSAATRDAVSAGATGTITGTATRSSGTGNAGFSGLMIALPASASGAPRQMMHYSRLRRT